MHICGNFSSLQPTVAILHLPQMATLNVNIIQALQREQGLTHVRMDIFLLKKQFVILIENGNQSMAGLPLVIKVLRYNYY